MKDEMKSFSNKYFSETKNDLRVIGDDERVFLGEVWPFFNQIYESDKPDGFAVIGGKALIIEHFEFDASQNTRKGSAFRREEAKNNKELQEIFNASLPSQSPIFHTSKLEYNTSSKNYLENFEKVFKDHYSRIQEYRKNIVFKTSVQIENIKTCFLIEDVTCLGSHIIVDGSNKPVVLFYIEEFLDLLESSPEVDYVFFGSFNGQKDWLWFMSRANISEYRKDQIELSSAEFFTFTPNRMEFVVPVENNS